MKIYHQNVLNHLSSYTGSLFKDSFIPNLTAQQKKIYAIAIFAIGLFVVSILSLIKAKAEVKKIKAEVQSIKDKVVVLSNKVEALSNKAGNKPNENEEAIKTQSIPEVEASSKTLLPNKAEAEAEVKKIKVEDPSIKVEALSNKAGNKPNENEEAIKTESIPEVNPLGKSQTPKIAFGKEQWTKYFGDIGNEPPLPKDIQKILESPCPFFPGKKVEETHLLVLIPDTINGESLNLDTLGKLVNTPKEGSATKYNYIWGEIINTVGQQATPKSHWVLMTKDVIEGKGSRNKNYAEQQAIIAEFNKQIVMNYEVPNALDAAICMFMHYVGSQERLFNDKPWTYTRCQENVKGYQVTVGGFSPAGLAVCAHSFIDNDDVGVAALRKFF